MDLINMIHQNDYYYHCKITEEHLITGEQEEIMNASSEEERQLIKEGMYEEDGWYELRWHKQGETSFADKEFDNFTKRIKEDIDKRTKGKYILHHDDENTYVLYENNHWLIKEKVLTRLHIYIYRHAIIDCDEDFIEKLLDSDKKQ